MALIYERIDIKVIAGAIVSLPIDYSKTLLTGNDFITDSYIQSLKPGIAVKMSENGFIVPATNADEAVLGFLVNDAAGYSNQNVNAQAVGSVAVLTGGGNQFVTDNVADSDIVVGNLLYVGEGGKLTKTKGTGKAVAVALNSNQVGNSSLLVATLV